MPSPGQRNPGRPSSTDASRASESRRGGPATSSGPPVLGKVPAAWYIYKISPAVSEPRGALRQFEFFFFVAHLAAGCPGLPHGRRRRSGSDKGTRYAVVWFGLLPLARQMSFSGGGHGPAGGIERL